VFSVLSVPIEPQKPDGNNPVLLTSVRARFSTLVRAQARVSHVKLLIFARFTLIKHMGKTRLLPRCH
jgi:hypothetical protein